MTQQTPMRVDLEARRAQMFPELTTEQLARVAAFGVEQVFDDRAMVFEQGERDIPFFVVLEGELEIVHPHGKQEDAVTVHGPREFTGEVSMLAERPALVRGRARGRLRVIRIENARFGLRGCVATDDKGFVRTGLDVTEDLLKAAQWPLARPPYIFETSRPHVFAVGDVRANSVKRVASAVGEGSVCIQLVHKALTE